MDNDMQHKIVIPNGKYIHFKGGMYEVIGMAFNSETLEDMVVYKNLHNTDLVWVRPALMWDEVVTVDGKNIKRFIKVEK